MYRIEINVLYKRIVCQVGHLPAANKYLCCQNRNLLIIISLYYIDTYVELAAVTSLIVEYGTAAILQTVPDFCRRFWKSSC